MSRTTRSIVIVAAVMVVTLAVALTLILRGGDARQKSKTRAAAQDTLPELAEPMEPTTAESATIETTTATTATATTATAPAANEDGIALLPPSMRPAETPAPLTRAPTDSPVSVAFAPDGRLLVARANGRIELLDLATGQRQPVRLKLASVRAAAMSPTGNLVVAADGAVTEVVHVASGTTTQLPNAGGAVAVAFTPGAGSELLVAQGGPGGAMTQWEVMGWKNRGSVLPNVGTIACLAPASDGTRVAVAGSTGVAIVSLGARTIKPTLAKGAGAHGVAFSPDGQTLAIAGPKGVSLWETTFWQKRADVGPEGATQVAFWRNGSVIVSSGGADGAVRIRDVATRNVVVTLGAGGQRITSMALSGDDRTLITCVGNDVIIWDTLTRTSRKLK